MVRPLGSQAHAGSIVEPKPAPLGLFARHFQPFPPPDAIDALDVDLPALGQKHLADAPVAVAAKACGQAHDGARQHRFVVRHLAIAPLRRTRLAHNSTRATLRNGKPRAYVVNTRPLAGRA